MLRAYTAIDYSVLDQVLVDLAPLKTGNWIKRHLHHADNTLEIAGFKGRIQSALNYNPISPLHSIYRSD